MDLVTDLPESTASGYTGILVIVDRLTKMAIYLPCRNNIDSPELAQMWSEHVICNRSVPDNIVTDRGKEFTSRFWKSVCSHLSINHRLSTAFHPQTDGQTERQNQTMEQYLQAFCNYEQDNWVELLPLAEFAYNNSVHHSTQMTQFWANNHYHPPMQFKTPKARSNMMSEVRADAEVSGMEETHRLLRESLLEAQARQSKYVGGNDVAFEVENKVWPLTRHFRTTRPSKKLDYERTGPYTVSKIINKNAYKLDLPKTMRNHNVFHVSQLDHYTPPVIGQPSSEPHQVIVDDSEEWEVERIIDSKQRYRKLHYLVQWAGYSHIRTSWETFKNLENACELINKFRRDQPNKPRRRRKSDPGSGGIDGNGEMETRSNWVFPCLFYCQNPVQYKWRRHGFYHLRKSSQLEVEFPREPECHPGRTEQLLDLQDCTSVYAGCSCVY